MTWMETVVTLVAGIVALMAAVLVRRPADVDELGSLSTQWVARHRLE